MPSKSRRLLIASLASALAVPVAALASDSSPDQGQKVHCYGVNKCKAMGDCGGPGTSCAGTNSCKRQGFIDMDKDLCLRLDGGRLTAEEKPAEPKPEKK